MPPSIQLALAALVLAAAIYDVRFRRIPNWLSMAGLCSGLALQSSLRGWRGLRGAALGAALAFGIYFLLFALHAMGAGDVKLMLAAGAMVGPSNWFVIFLLASILGGVLAVMLIVLRGRLQRTANNVLIVIGQLGRLRAPFRVNPELDVSHPAAVTLPHGVSIAAGCLTYLVLSDLGV